MIKMRRRGVVGLALVALLFSSADACPNDPSVPNPTVTVELTPPTMTIRGAQFAAGAPVVLSYIPTHLQPNKGPAVTARTDGTFVVSVFPPCFVQSQLQGTPAHINGDVFARDDKTHKVAAASLPRLNPCIHP